MPRGQVNVGAGTAQQFAALARDLRRAGAANLRKQLYSGLQRAARPIVQDIKDSATTSLPRRGGLNERVAGASIQPKSVGNQAGRTAAIRITAKERTGKKIDLRRLDGGTVRHPVFGHKKRKWYTTRVQAGWFSRPAEAGVPHVQKELQNVVDAIERDIGAH